MFNLVSALVGLVALALGLVALVPLLGWLNYIVIPAAVLGAGIGTLSGSNGGRNLNLFVLVIAVIRLWMGGFLF
ncbi:hypothetical protein GCM10023219_01090 [Stakelama sediminis]|uniref:Uncharacterized protein n=1 Tax=Stakelama sediminis TaxID=463200 RepID=A0A840Z0M3_9SPHN|nr:hypothetical protein [Stakelama sediminis]MBB5719455.1 hypothetical protein [Stakelama sediminis]